MKKYAKYLFNLDSAKNKMEKEPETMTKIKEQTKELIEGQTKDRIDAQAKEPKKARRAKLVLEDGAEYYGTSFGAEINSSGEVVFSTGMTGYPESLTDPSYAGQILVFTYPLIGNYGIGKPETDECGIQINFESDKVQVRGVIVSECCAEHNHWNSAKSMQQWLVENNVPAVQGIDTRELTTKLREHGVMLGKIIVENISSCCSEARAMATDSNLRAFEDQKSELDRGKPPTGMSSPQILHSNASSAVGVRQRNCLNFFAEPSHCSGFAHNIIKNNNNTTNKNKKSVSDENTVFNDPNSENLVSTVSTKQKIVYSAGKIRVLLIDCGVKNSIIRCLLKRNATVIRVPWNYDISNEKYDGILISNGPGNPKQCKETIKNIRSALEQKKPVFGICLGNQILALAAGADTYKLKYGHRSQNQPCIELGTKRCYITSQNHGYAVDEKTLPESWEPWFRNANDLTNEGIRHKTKPFFSVQFHPEARPGPVDTEYIFNKFIELVNNVC